MNDFNMFTFNSRVWPGTDPWVVKKGERVRFTFGNLSMDSHPIHVHGYTFDEVGTDGDAPDLVEQDAATAEATGTPLPQEARQITGSTTATRIAAIQARVCVHMGFMRSLPGKPSLALARQCALARNK